ncbi:hypothetical protein GQ607_005046 [Colletotrichum asianum]|uniref:Uncharacterized protein n=1 Tax=Colletotrichum asianum TaxID=702518 RepID=A0A8H3WL69_9PEZI|nr:hypothetical protein GQ607_005046 [Colletotrichum asianum]
MASPRPQPFESRSILILLTWSSVLCPSNGHGTRLCHPLDTTAISRLPAPRLRTEPERVRKHTTHTPSPAHALPPPPPPPQHLRERAGSVSSTDREETALCSPPFQSLFTLPLLPPSRLNLHPSCP